MNTPDHTLENAISSLNILGVRNVEEVACTVRSLREAGRGNPAKTEAARDLKHSSFDNHEITKVIETSVKEGPAATLHTHLDSNVVRDSANVGVVRATLSGVLTGLNKGSRIKDPT